ncbi:hypothetical protein KC959_02700 [Candidatus Saccharibacteria bacterium]|nr:hypothetical protein [Candidatus Saccharibacteria bacterium]
MDNEEYQRVQYLKQRAIPIMPPTPTAESCRVEKDATDIVLYGDCRRRVQGCAVCKLSGLSCDGVIAIAQGYDSMGPLPSTTRSLRGDRSGSAG